MNRRIHHPNKRSIYAEAGIPEYWMVDGDDRTICVARSGHEDVIARDAVTWHPAGVGLPLVLSLEDVFGPLHRRERDA